MFEIKENQRNPYFIIIAVLVLGNILFALNYFSVSHKLKAIDSTKTKTEINSKVLDFTALFIKDVLQAETEVNFETRLNLENAVRDLNDPEIKAQWQKFVASKTELEAQTSVKNLLGILVGKIRK